MKKKMSSHDFNEILNEANNKITSVTKSIQDIKTEMETKLKILDYKSETIDNSLKSLSLSNNINNNKYITLLNEDIQKGIYTSYGNLVHPCFKVNPINIFNIYSAKNNTIYYRDEAKVDMNGIHNDYYNNLLKADNYEDKQLFLEEYDSCDIPYFDPIEKVTKRRDYDMVTLDIKVDQTKIINFAKFNMIEFDSFLYDCYSVANIKIYDSLNESAEPIYTDNNVINSLNKTRIILDKKYEFKRVTMDIFINTKFNRDNIIKVPLAIKHIYFYEADFRNDSYVIYKYTSNDYIDYIEDDFNILTAYNSEESSTLSECNITMYLDYIDGQLSYLQEPSNNVKRIISRNVKSIYFKVPLSLVTDKTYLNSIYGFKFAIHTR